MTENPAEQKIPAENELLDDIERRQDEVLAQIDTLNTQLEQVLKLHSAPAEQTIADATNGEDNEAQQPVTEQSSLTEPVGGTITKDVEEEMTAQEMPAEAPTATPAIEPLIAPPVEHAGPLMIVPVPENSVPEILASEIPASQNGAAPSEC